MDTQKTKKAAYNKALLAFVVACSCFLIYVLACVFSPVSWSPDFSKIALLVTSPGIDENKLPDKCAIFTYDIATGEYMLLDEVEKDGFLSAPSWSPDGKWIAYYRVEPTGQRVESSSEGDPNADAPKSVPTKPTTTKEANEPQGLSTTVEELFSEENKMLPPFLFEIIEEKLDKEKKDGEIFDVKLMIVRPDGTEQKVLRVIESQCDQNDRQTLMLMRPEWTKDCKRLFYSRMIGSDKSYYIGSLDIETGKMYAHLFTSTVPFEVSPDGNWVASLSESNSAKALLTLAKTDGSLYKYFRLDLDVDEESLFRFIQWLPDSKRLFVWAKEEFWVTDADTGNIDKYRDPDSNEPAYPVFSSTGNKVYYLTGYETDEPNAPKDLITLKCLTLADRKIETVFELSVIPDIDNGEGGPFLISPDGKTVLMRGAIKDKSGNKRPAIFFWDGKTKKIIETDPWLIKPLFTDEDMIFEEKLIGKWKEKEGEMLLLSEGVQEKTYNWMTLIDTDGEKETGTANLFKLKGTMFLRLYSDESDQITYVKVDQIEPRLLLREMDYNELAEMLKKDPNSLKQETEKSGDIFELERVSIKP